MLKNLKNFNSEYNLYIKDYIPVIDINENSSVGEQIKHYRQLKGIQQKDIAKYINIDRYTMHQIENYEYKQLSNIKYIKEVLNYLDISDKIIWNDKYLEFICLNKQPEIKEFRMKYNISLQDLSTMLNVGISTLKQWEKNTSRISRKNFEKYMQIKTSFINSKEVDNDKYNYYLFLKNNNLKEVIKNYINKEEITLKEFAKRMNRHPNTIIRIMNKENTLTYKQYLRLKELLDKQLSGTSFFDPYIKFINSDYHKYIRSFLKEFNISRAQLARDLNVGRCTAEKWARKDSVISRKNYIKLNNYINKKRGAQTIN